MLWWYVSSCLSVAWKTLEKRSSVKLALKRPHIQVQTSLQCNYMGFGLSNSSLRKEYSFFWALPKLPLPCPLRNLGNFFTFVFTSKIKSFKINFGRGGPLPILAMPKRKVFFFWDVFPCSVLPWVLTLEEAFSPLRQHPPRYRGGKKEESVSLIFSIPRRGNQPQAVWNCFGCTTSQFHSVPHDSRPKTNPLIIWN